MFKKNKRISAREARVMEWRELNAEFQRDRKAREAEEEYKKAHRNDRQNVVIKGVLAV